MADLPAGQDKRALVHGQAYRQVAAEAVIKLWLPKELTTQVFRVHAPADPVLRKGSWEVPPRSGPLQRLLPGVSVVRAAMHAPLAAPPLAPAGTRALALAVAHTARRLSCAPSGSAPSFRGTSR